MGFYVRASLGVGEIGLYTEPLHQYGRSLEGAEEDEGVTQQLSSLCISMEGVSGRGDPEAANVVGGEGADGSLYQIAHYQYVFCPAARNGKCPIK